MTDIWTWTDPTAYVSAGQARESREAYDRIRKNEPDEFAALVRRFREHGY